MALKTDMKNDGNAKWLQRAVEIEKAQIENITLAGYCQNCLFLGEPVFIKCCEQKHAYCKAIVTPKELKEAVEGEKVVSSLEAVSIGSEIIDCVYLAHALENSKDPHAVLREAYRILRSEAKIMISGFNPWSMVGTLWFKKLLGKNPPWKEKLISVFKLTDWLILLGFQDVQVKWCGYGLPIGCTHKCSYACESATEFNLPFGGIYIVTATKRITPLTPVTPYVAEKKQVVSSKIAEPTTMNK